MEYRLVKVIWRDIQGHDGAWVDCDDILDDYEPVTVYTVGWILKEDDEFLTIVSSLSADQTFAGNVNAIPRGCVQSVFLITLSGLSDVHTEKSESL